MGTAIAGPVGTIFRVARGRSSPLGRRMNCHQMKNAVDRKNTTIETYAFSRRPRYSCAGSIAQQLLEEAPEAVVGDVQREQPRPPDLEAPVDPEQDRPRRRCRTSARRGRSGGRCRRGSTPAGRCCGSISSPHGRSVGLPNSSWLNQLPHAPDPLRQQQTRRDGVHEQPHALPGAVDDPRAGENAEEDPAPHAEPALPDGERPPPLVGHLAPARDVVVKARADDPGGDPPHRDAEHEIPVAAPASPSDNPSARQHPAIASKQHQPVHVDRERAEVDRAARRRRYGWRGSSPGREFCPERREPARC